MKYWNVTSAAALLIAVLVMAAPVGAAEYPTPSLSRTDTLLMAPKMRLLRRYPLAGGGHWDYLTVDAMGNRLFITRGDRVEVFDTKTDKLLGTVAQLNAVHGVALAEDLRRGYASSGGANSVLAFDMDTLKVVKEAPIAGKNPDAIVYESMSKRVFTFNGKSNDATVLDALSLAVVGTIRLPNKPEFAVDDETGQIFVNIESKVGKIVVINAMNMSVKATWRLPGCASPSGLAIDKVHHRLFSVCDAGILVVTDAQTGRHISKVTIGEEPDAAAYDEKRGLIFSSNGSGTLSVIHQDSADHYSVAQTLKTKRGARTMALDPNSGKVFLVTSQFGPPPPATAADPEPYPIPIPGTLEVLVAGAP